MRRMNGKMIGIGLLVAFLGCLLIVGVASAAPEFKWKFGVPWPRPTQNEYHKMFCDLVGKYSNGRIEMKYYPNGQLGTHDEHFHAVQENSIQVAMFAPYVNLVPGGMMNWMPWTIENWDEAKVAFEAGKGVLWKVMEDAYNEVGMHMLYQTSFGAYGLGNSKRPLNSPEDLKNLKMRVSASLAAVRMLENMGKGTGMTLQTIPWGDVYDALSKGVVDGMWSMWPSLVDERHGEVLKYYSDVNFLWDTNNVVVNKEVWEKLPQDLKDAVNKAALEVETKLYEKQQAIEADYKQKLAAMKTFQITALTPEQRDAFRQKSNMPAVWDELCKPWLEKKYPGQNMTQKLQDELKKIHEQVSGKK